MADETKVQETQKTDEQKIAEDVQAIAQEVTRTDGQPRYKSWLLWASIISLAVICIKLATGHDYSQPVDTIAGYALAALSALGIINNPTNKANI